MQGNTKPVGILLIGKDTRSIEHLLGRGIESAAGNFAVVKVTELDSAAQVLDGKEIGFIFLADEIAGDQPGRVVSCLQLWAPRLPIIIFGENLPESCALDYIALGVADVVDLAEIDAVHLLRTMGRVLKRQSSGSQLVRQMTDFLLTSSYEGAVAFDLQLRVILWNPAMERMFNIRRHEIIGRVVTDVLPQLKETGEEALLYEVLAGKSLISKDRKFTRPGDDECRYFTAYYTQMRNQAGATIGAIGLFRDVTGRKDAELSAHENAQRLLAVTNASPNLLWISDARGERIFFNGRWLEFTGGTIEEDSGLKWKRYVHPQDLKRYLSLHAAAKETREPLHTEVRLRSKDGRYVRLFESSIPQFLPDRTFIGYVAYCTDVNATRAAIPKPHSRTWGSLEMAPIGVINLNTDLVVENANARMSDLLGKPIEEIKGRPIGQVLDSFNLDKIREVLATGEKIHIENRKLSDDKAETAVYVDIACWPTKNGVDQISGLCMSFVEVTDRFVSSKRKEDFIAALVHDLKTPLLGAERTLEAMLSGAIGQVDPQQGEILSILRNSNRSLVTMVQSLIDVYRCENDLLNLSLHTVSVTDIVQQCISELSALFEERGVILTDNITASVGPGQVLGDRTSLRRVINNLLDNALKFTDRGGKVHVVVVEHRSSVLINVTDTGIGIPEQDLNKVFLKCWQGSASKFYGGTAGLGLYLCKQIVEAHEGKISVASQPGKGATFTVDLPLLSSKHSELRKSVGSKSKPF